MPTPSSSAAPWHAQQVFVARQPIFDRDNHRVAYELLYRSSQQATGAGSISSEVMCSDTALHSVVSIGLDRLTAGVTAFVNVTREHLLGELYKIFDPSTVVLELLESIDGEPAVLAACQRALAEGYTLALDDYDGRPSLDVLLPLVKIVKLDVLHCDLSALAVQVQSLRARGITVLAERVETREVYDRCVEIGCALFQGYVFSRPETLAGRAISMQQVTMFNIINLLRDPDVTDSGLEDAFRSHPSLSLALLRIVNSASFGARSVASIHHAIRLIGREALSRWLLVMLVASVGRDSEVANEAVTQAMVRGRFCELLTMQTGNGEPSTRFLVGLLSRMDVLLGLPIASVLERLPVDEDVRAALLRGQGPHAPTLALAIAYESGNWGEVDRGEDADAVETLSELYADAVAWAVERLGSIVDAPTTR